MRAAAPPAGAGAAPRPGTLSAPVLLVQAHHGQRQTAGRGRGEQRVQEPAHRRRGPVQVVHRDHHRLVGGEAQQGVPARPPRRRERGGRPVRRGQQPLQRRHRQGDPGRRQQRRQGGGQPVPHRRRWVGVPDAGEPAEQLGDRRQRLARGTAGSARRTSAPAPRPPWPPPGPARAAAGCGRCPPGRPATPSGAGARVPPGSTGRARWPARGGGRSAGRRAGRAAAGAAPAACHTGHRQHLAGDRHRRQPALCHQAGGGPGGGRTDARRRPAARTPATGPRW